MKTLKTRYSEIHMSNMRTPSKAASQPHQAHISLALITEDNLPMGGRSQGGSVLSRSVSVRTGVESSAFDEFSPRVRYYTDVTDAIPPDEHTYGAYTIYLIGVTTQTLPTGKRIISWYATPTCSTWCLSTVSSLTEICLCGWVRVAQATGKALLCVFGIARCAAKSSISASRGR